MSDLKERAREAADQIIRESGIGRGGSYADLSRAIETKLATFAAQEVERALDGAALECDALYMAEREKVNRAVESGDDESYRLHKRRGDGFFESEKAIRALQDKEKAHEHERGLGRT